jgi:predicted tellurium resistance membrane protein TerC
MIAAVVISMIVMILVSGNISDFIERNPTIKILALSFLILIGTMLIVEGMGTHVSKGYVYFAMAFSLGVESLNIHYRKKTSEKK